MSSATAWMNEPATQKQLTYINAMYEYSPHQIPKFDGKTKVEAAQYIDKYVWPIYNYTSKLDELEQANVADKDIRLIDANALIDDLYLCKEQAGEAKAEQWDDLIERVDLADTIKAIPIEWIKKKQHQYKDANKLMSDAYAAVMGEFLDEQAGERK